MTKNFFKKGITLVEVLIVCSVLGIILAVVIPQFAKTRELQVLKSATGDILSSLNKARSQTLASLNSSSYGVHFQSNKVIIFKGTVFSQSDINNETVAITSPATISSITLVGGGADIYFNRLSGVPSKTGSVIVSGPNFTKTITIDATGAASVN
ncbi:hypothetical protein A2917_03355 [Candidatus Nomurabacteria bacterium RIFCSPLOWO2_01_FULL_42_17]|uniref:General secretion pathway GspH domain-containing protein n=1 Tax=Candidatus Nomurabacteria bacterium RIFCSPLOWO2_01_FULL_42_17 TaxID=1801780 RepID=A0A1F6XN87_9BACT|nr:MAG: hypothetical protein A2917_03355 [Candidatus Nomurabacteria bacterium RIFCSPLOWO2_01_FULL_42_17]